MKQYELLLPVGNAEMALAAIHNGADAIYVGFPGFNARGRTIDLELEELREIIRLCHLHGVRAHLAFNIVIFQDELERLVPMLEQVLPLKPDALIVQDLGLAKLIRQMAPAQVIHASTQMTVTNHEAISLLEDLDIKRFVLGRENSLKEISKIRERTSKDLEVFVHGALCVSYSGQCFTSESIGGRSANRGQCAQSCRFGYELWVDGRKKQLIKKEHLLSPQDLCGLAEIPELMNLGVDSFKVEGRLKSPEYVAASAREYRLAMDRHRADRDLTAMELEQAKARMATTYSRGYFTGWLHGVDHQQLVDGVGKSHRGLRIGRVIQVAESGESRISIELNGQFELSSGDGLLWVGWKDDHKIEGGAQIYEVFPRGRGLFEVTFGNDVELVPELKGAELYLSHDASIKKELWRSFHDKACFKRLPIDMAVEVQVGAPLRVTVSDGVLTCSESGEVLVDYAKKKAVSDEFIREELGALGGTVFTLRNLTVSRNSPDPIFYPQQELKSLRRKLTSQLERLRSESRVTREETEVLPAKRMLNWMEEQRGTSESSPALDLATRFTILLREIGQVTDFVGAWKQGFLDQDLIDCVILDFEFGMNYEAAIQALKEAGIRSGIATTRILKPGEYTHFTRIERLQPEVLLVRNLGALQYLTSVKPGSAELRGDFSLNVTNHLTARYLLGKGLRTLTASYDLNARQVSDLLAAADSRRMEVTIHQYMPSFHMEHCVFAAFLSTGSSFRDCGKPCEKHQVELKDQFGNHHWIKPDPECRNTMYNATSQSAARYLAEWVRLGLGFVRYEALHERGEELLSKIRGYQDLLRGRKTAGQVISELKLYENYGLGEGAISKAQEYQSRKK